MAILIHHNIVPPPDCPYSRTKHQPSASPQMNILHDCEITGIIHRPRQHTLQLLIGQTGLLTFENTVCFSLNDFSGQNVIFAVRTLPLCDSPAPWLEEYPLLARLQPRSDYQVSSIDPSAGCGGFIVQTSGGSILYSEDGGERYSG
ncbi:MAG: hypothetical protein Q3966_07820 [Neisseria sp.]|nr:hypothetical protein [Neisseria sp.]